jgi:AcrR family transcriptional regulator
MHRALCQCGTGVRAINGITSGMAKNTASEAALTRRRIISCSQVLFATLGYRATRTADVARDAGVSEGALFHHFKDKTALFKAVVERLQYKFAAEIVASTAQESVPLTIFLTGSRKSLELSQNSEYLRIVMLEAPTVLGEFDWRQQDARVGLMMIEPNLRNIAGRDDIPDAVIKPMALLVMGLINETIFALSRGDEGVSVDGCIGLLEAAVVEWAKRVNDGLHKQLTPASGAAL